MQVQHLIQDPPMPHMPSETQQSGVSSKGSMQAHGCSISSSTSSSHGCDCNLYHLSSTFLMLPPLLHDQLAHCPPPNMGG